MPKIIKIPLIALASLLACLILLWIVLQTHWAQQILLNKFTKNLSKSLHTTVSAEDLNISFFDHIELSKVYIEDLNGDTMFYLENLEADYDLFSWKANKLSFDYVKVSDAYVNLGIYEKDSVLNIQFLINYFSPKQRDSLSPSSYLSFNEIKLEHTRFRYFNENMEDSKLRDFNEADMVFSNINADLKDFEIIDDSLHFTSKHLETTESCGLRINHLESVCTISSTVMDFKDLVLETEKSNIRDHLRFNYHSYVDFVHFISDVELYAKLDQSRVHFDDLYYFSNNLAPYHDLIQAKGTVTGTLDRLKAKDLDISMGKFTSYRGQARITGIPDISNTFWDLDATLFKSNANEIAYLVQLEEIPKELKKLGNLEFEGNFKGFTREFVCYGELQTSIGHATTDLKFNINPQGKEVYSGSLTSHSLMLGELLDEKQLGKAAFSIQVDGEGLKMENMNAKVSGTITTLQYNGYPYSNIVLNGNLKQDIFEGFAAINDPNLIMDFDGIIDLSKGQSHTTANTTISKANLQTLGIDNRLSYLSLVGSLDITGSSLNELEGKITLDSLVWSDEDQSIPLNHLSLLLENNNKRQCIDIESELMNVLIEGVYEISDLPDIADQILWSVSHADSVNQAKKLDASFTANIDLKQFHPLYEQYLNGLYFDAAHLNIEYNSTNGKVALNSTLLKPLYGAIAADKLTANLKKNNEAEAGKLTFHSENFSLSDSLLFYTIEGESDIKGDAFQFTIKAKRDSNLNADMQGRLLTLNDSIAIYIDEVNAMINKKTWHMSKTDFANIVYHEGVTELFYFDFRNNQEIIFFDGAFGENVTKINVVFDQFLLENSNPFLAAYDVNLGGVANGYIDLTYRQGFPIFESDFVIDHLSLEGDTLGHFILLTQSGSTPLDVQVNGSVVEGLLDGTLIKGNVDFNNPKSALHLNVSTEKSSVKPFAKYLVGLASEISGYSTANLNITGPLSDPKISGTTDFSELAFKVDYIQTSYKATASVEVGNNYFKITNSDLIDRFGHHGKVSGQVTHNNYRNFKFDILIDSMENFECLNTTRKDNELFYGTAFADGYMEVKGPLDNILLLIRAKSRKGTKIHIPLDNLENDGQLSYVRFVNLTADNNQLRDMVQTTEGVQMDFNFDITNDADVELIFDELLGDKIKGNGHGTLRMEVNTYGEFNMYGNIVIDKGDYLFTAFNFINKYFVVTPGSTLSWDGDPYNATVDLKATKREYPQPSSLLAGMVDELDEYNTPIPVDCELKLSGLLFNPEIGFGISFPSSNSLSSSNNSTFTTVIERIKQDPEELDRQVFALLALGTFIPPSFANTSGIVNANTGNTSTVNATLTHSVNNSLSDFVSSQLSNWLSQIDPRWQVGIDYQIATSDEAKAELILSLKRKFLNDRLELQGSYDASATTGSRPYDFNVQYNLSKDGSFKIKGFQRNANDPTLGNLNNVTTSGVGLFYRHQFDHFWFERGKKK